MLPYMRHKVSNNPRIKNGKEFSFWQKGDLVLVGEREITFGFQASVAWTKCIDSQTVMLEKGEK